MGVNGVQTSKWLGLVVKQQMPHPSRYHLVWALQSGTTPVFFWQPVPADALTHVALGMVATLSEEAPSTKLVHCVPRAWVEPAPDDVKMVWQDSGAGGKPGSLWSVGSLGLLAAAQATRPPVEMSWRLRRTRFWLGESEVKTARARARRPPPRPLIPSLPMLSFTTARAAGTPCPPHCLLTQPPD